MTSWAILTGEYPPKLGGVADYTRVVASALAAAGDTVDVFAPAAPGDAPGARDPGVTVHTLPDHWGPRSVLFTERELARRPSARVLVQYVPHSFGMRGMNVPFVTWLAARRRPFWVMFHEVAFPIVRGAPLKHNVIGVVQRGMATMMAASAARTFASIPAWNDILRSYLPSAREAEWMPIPSHVHGAPTVAELAALRASLGIAPDDVVLGHFGTYRPTVTRLLAPLLRTLLEASPARVALLVGRGSREFAARELSGCRAVAVGELPLDAVASHLAASTVAIQPYDDGVSSRRTTVMAALALGVPVVTNSGHLTEALWRDAHVVALASRPDPAETARVAEDLLADPAALRALGERGRATYRETFSLERTLRVLRGAAS